MADYNSMYLQLFNAVTDAVRILQAAQVETEQMYVDYEPAYITMLKRNDENVGDGDA